MSQLYNTTQGDKIATALTAKRHTMTHTNTPILFTDLLHTFRCPMFLTHFLKPSVSGQKPNIDHSCGDCSAACKQCGMICSQGRPLNAQCHKDRRMEIADSNYYRTQCRRPLEFRWSYRGPSHDFLRGASPKPPLHNGTKFLQKAQQTRSPFSNRHTKGQQANATFIQSHTSKILKDIYLT